MEKIFEKLRKNNKAEYILYLACNIFAVAIITAYALLLFSPTVLNVLPVGGDSRKQAFGIFAVICIGCVAFTLYASLIFFKKKQEELGIMMALGGNRKKLYGAIAKETGIMGLISLVVGMLLAFPINKGIWGILRLFVNTEEMVLNFDLSALGISFGMGIIVLLTSMITLKKIVSSVELMEVINAEHKNEMVKKIPKHMGALGIIITTCGGVFSYYSSSIYMNLFQAYPPETLSLIYIIPLAGIYMIMLHAVINGFGSTKKYHRKMISRSMMKFQGKQTVNCMLIITLLLGGGCFAAFYTPVMMTGFSTSYNAKTLNYQYVIPDGVKGPSEREINELAGKYGASIEKSFEIPVIMVAGDGMQEYEEGRNFYYEYNKRMLTSYIIRESDFEKIIGGEVMLECGNYYAVTDKEEAIRYSNDTTVFTNMTTRKESKVSFGGCLHCEDLVLESESIYVVPDLDYEALNEGLSLEWTQTLYYMNVQNDSYQFAEELYEKFYSSFGKEFLISSAYDKVAAISCYEKGKDYWCDKPEYNQLSNFSSTNNEFQREWKYFPCFKIMSIKNTLRNYAVFIMLFIYVAFVALVSAWLIAYTRCLTIGMRNKYVFNDLEKLGASKAFRLKELRRQLTSVYFTPTVVGMTIIYMFFALVLYGNDGGRYTSSELIGLLICLGIEIIIAAITYLIYRFTVRELKEKVL